MCIYIHSVYLFNVKAVIRHTDHIKTLHCREHINPQGEGNVALYIYSEERTLDV